MSSGTRKGFKYKTKGSKATSNKTVVEDIDFDEVEKETTTSPQKRTSNRNGKGGAGGSPIKRGRKAVVETDSEVELSPSPKRAKVTSKTTTTTTTTKSTIDKSPAKNAKPKAHYPTNTSLDIPKIVQKIKKGKNKDSSHKIKLGLLLKEICDSEMDRYV